MHMTSATLLSRARRRYVIILVLAAVFAFLYTLLSHPHQIMETPFKLPIEDGKFILGNLTKRADAPRGKKLVVFVHGFGADSNRHLFYNGARVFAANGLDTARFDLHPGGEGRNFTDTTIDFERNDLETVLKHFRPQYKHICVAAHSLGGIVALESDSKLYDSLILIACAAREALDETKIITRLGDTYIANYSPPLVVGEAMVKSMEATPPIKELAAKITRPLLVVCGQNDFFVKYSRELYETAKAPKSLEIIPGAEHLFNENGTAPELYKTCEDFLGSM